MSKDVTPARETKRYAGAGTYGNRKEVYHTDTECRFASDNLREVSPAEIEYHDMRLCKWCDPDENPNSQSTADRSAYNALVEMGEENASL